MQLWHSPARTHATFDDPNLVSRAGLVPAMALAERCGLSALVRRNVQITAKAGVNADLKAPCLIAGMAAGAGSIDDMDVLRHGAMGTLFDGIRAPSTLGSFLRSFTWGNVRQLESAGREFLSNLAVAAPLLPGKDVLAFTGIDSMQKRVRGHTKIGGKSLLVRGLNVLAAVVSTPLGAPVIAATRLRGGSANSARGAASLAAESITAARAAGCTARIVVRMDSACYAGKVIAAIRRNGAFFSVTARMDNKIRNTIAKISEDAWTPVTYPRAIWDEDQRQWISDAEVAEVPYTAFASRKGQAVTARLIVRRVRDLNRKAAGGQDELFTCWRYHAVLTDSPFQMIEAEARHRDHAIAGQVFADVTSGPLAHLPSGSFPANAAWLTCAAMAHNLTRAAGALAGAFHARARGATIRSDLIAVAARVARHGRGEITLHLPQEWHREQEWMNLFEASCGPPPRAA